MELGEFVGGIPYGYKSVNGQLEINETEAEIVRRIFREYLSGMGIYKIKDSLNEDLIPRRKKRRALDERIGTVYTNEFTVNIFGGIVKKLNKQKQQIR